MDQPDVEQNLLRAEPRKKPRRHRAAIHQKPKQQRSHQPPAPLAPQPPRHREKQRQRQHLRPERQHRTQGRRVQPAGVAGHRRAVQRHAARRAQREAHDVHMDKIIRRPMRVVARQQHACHQRRPDERPAARHARRRQHQRERREHRHEVDHARQHERQRRVVRERNRQIPERCHRPVKPAQVRARIAQRVKRQPARQCEARRQPRRVPRHSRHCAQRAPHQCQPARAAHDQPRAEPRGADNGRRCGGGVHRRQAPLDHAPPALARRKCGGKTND